MPPLGDATYSAPGGVAMYNSKSAASRSSTFFASQDTLYALAVDTGGKALLDNHELAQGNQNAITVAERADLTLDYRQSYYAGKEFAKFTQVDNERQLETR